MRAHATRSRPLSAARQMALDHQKKRQGHYRAVRKFIRSEIRRRIREDGEDAASVAAARAAWDEFFQVAFELFHYTETPLV